MIGWCCFSRAGDEKVLDVLFGPEIEARDERVQTGVGSHLRGIEEQFLSPDQSRRLTQGNDPLEKLVEDFHTQAIADAGQAGMLGQWLIEVVAEIPPVRQVQAGHLDQPSLRADALEEHDELKLEENHWVDGWSPGGLVAILSELAHEAQIQFGFQVPVEVTTRNQGLQRDQHRAIETASLPRTEHQSPHVRRVTRRFDRNTGCYRVCSSSRAFFQQAEALCRRRHNASLIVPFETEQQAVVEVTGVVQAVLVENERVGQRADLQQAVPIRRAAGQT